jgi:hypothetical protein
MTTKDGNSNDVDENQDECCPICLLLVPLVVTKCSHLACVGCYERIFLATSSNFHLTSNASEEELEDEITRSCPTRSRCPLCRTMVDMFDLRHSDGTNAGSLVYKTEDNLRNSVLNDLTFSEVGLEKKTISFLDGVPEITICKGANDSVQTLRKISFESNYNYHSKSKSFSGTVNWMKVGLLCLSQIRIFINLFFL